MTGREMIAAWSVVSGRLDVVIGRKACKVRGHYMRMMARVCDARLEHVEELIAALDPLLDEPILGPRRQGKPAGP